MTADTTGGDNSKNEARADGTSARNVSNDQVMNDNDKKRVSYEDPNHKIGGGDDDDDAVEKELRSSRAQENRRYRFSNRGNSEFKWKEDHTVVGALEVPSEPIVNLRGHYTEKKVLTFEKEFIECIQLWNKLKLRKSFISAAESIPPITRCCGLAQDVDETIRNLAPLLNRGWAKKVNEKLKEHDYQVECYVWSWRNPLGSAETNVLLIRFHSLAKERN